MLGQCRRRWANIETTLDQYVMFVGKQWYQVYLQAQFAAYDAGDGK